MAKSCGHRLLCGGRRDAVKNHRVPRKETLVYLRLCSSGLLCTSSWRRGSKDLSPRRNRRKTAMTGAGSVFAKKELHWCMVCVFSETVVSSLGVHCAFRGVLVLSADGAFAGRMRCVFVSHMGCNSDSVYSQPEPEGRTVIPLCTPSFLCFLSKPSEGRTGICKQVFPRF